MLPCTSRVLPFTFKFFLVLLLATEFLTSATLMPTAAMAPSKDSVHSSQIVLDVDGYPVAPADLALAQVHVYLRHGERTPVRVRMAEPPASIPAHWTLCRTARQFHAAVATFGEAVLDAPRSSDRIDFLPAKRIVEQADGSVLDGECLLGELTDVGRQSTYNLGRSLRKLYVDKLGFLPDTMSDNTEGYFRSTNIPRTIESLQQVMHGLYPRAKLAHGITPELRVRNGVDENLIANSYTCKRLEQLLIGFAQAAAAAYNHTLEPLDEKLSKYIGGRPVRIDGQPRASGILDTIKASMANGIGVPPEFEDREVLDLIERAVVTEWFSDKTEEARRLGMGRLLDDLSHKMALKAAPSSTAKSNQPRILLHSTHDTALAAMLATFEVFDDKWPAFTASITFELFKKTSVEQGQTSYLQTVLGTFSPFKIAKPAEHFVRMRYQNQTMVLPFCTARGKHLEGHPEFCSLAAFRERVRELVPADWEEACKLRPAS